MRNRKYIEKEIEQTKQKLESLNTELNESIAKGDLVMIHLKDSKDFHWVGRVIKVDSFEVVCSSKVFSNSTDPTLEGSYHNFSFKKAVIERIKI